MVSAPPPALVFADEITDFLATAPTLREIVAFKPSGRANERLHELLDHANEGILSDAEQHEMEAFLQVSHFLKMLKGKARLRLNEQP